MMNIKDIQVAAFLDGTDLRPCTVRGAHKSGIRITDSEGNQRDVSPRRLFYSAHRLIKAGVLKAEVE